MNGKRRLILLCLSGCCLLYVSGTLTLFLLVKYRQEHSEVAYCDVLLPNRWPRFQAAKGRSLIEKSFGQFKTGNFAAGFLNLRMGLSRYPASREGRLLLAQLYADSHRADLAKELLVKGLTYHPQDTEYARILFSYLFSVQADEEIIGLAEQIRRTSEMAGTLGDLAGMAAATACFQRGYFDRAERYLHESGQQTTREGRLLTARIQWDRGYTELALHQLRNLAADYPTDEEVYARFSACLRQSGRFDEARRLTLVFQLARPESAQPRVDLLHAYAQEGNVAALRQTTEEILRLYPRDEKILLALGDFAATTGDYALSRQIRSLLPSGSQSGQHSAVLTLEALITAREYSSALVLADELEALTPPLSEPLLNLCHGLKAIAHYGTNDPAAGLLALNRFLSGTNPRAGNLLAISNHLRTAGARKPAHDLLARAAEADPDNQPVLSRLIEMEMEQGSVENLPAHLRRLMKLRKPSRDLLARASHQLGSDRYLFSREHRTALEAIRQHLDPLQQLASPQLN